MSNPNKYRADQVLGKNRDMSTPKRGPRVEHPRPATVPIGHDHSRDFEKISGTGNIARDATVSKHHVAEIHGGMSRTTGTTLGAPVTASPLDDAKMSIDPVVGKRTQAPAQPVVGHRSRSQMGEVGPGCCENGKSANHEAAMSVSGLAHAARHINGANIIEDGLEHAGPDHPANLRRR
jgi:hypothetical protein